MTEWKLVPVEPTKEMLNVVNKNAYRGIDASQCVSMRIMRELYYMAVDEAPDATQDEALVTLVARVLDERTDIGGRDISWNSRVEDARAVLAVLKDGA